MQYYSSNQFDYIETSNYSTDGKKDGDYTETYADSKETKVKGQYSNGQKDGKWMYYDTKGKLIRQEIFENGTQKSSQRF